MTLTEREKVFVGLGNPGKKYEMTRHNIGAIVVHSLALRLGWQMKPVKRVDVVAAKGVVDGTTIHLVTPELYMNESGRAVSGYLNYFGFRPKHLVVVVDDVDLPFGMLRLREGGSAGGHNGLKSIESSLGTQNYARLRVGVGEKKHEKMDLADHVLGKFPEDERAKLGEVVEKSGAVLLRTIHEEIVDIMNDVNKKIKTKPAELAESTQESDHDKSRET